MAVATVVDSAVSTEQVRTCGICLNLLPIGEFRLRRKGSKERHSECRECHRRSGQLRRHARKSKLLRKLIAKINRARTAQELLAFITTDLIRQLGGLAGFAAYFKQQLDARFDDHPGAASGLRGMQAIITLIAAAGPQRDSDREAIARMSDEEIANQTFHMLSTAQPYLLAEELRLRGWTVIPPEWSPAWTLAAGLRPGSRCGRAPS